MGIAEDLIIIILTGLLTGLVANKLRIPPIIGYIISGIIIGPHTGGFTVSNISQIELLAEIGVALLLFSIGLDFSFRELKSVKAIALIGTPIQIVLLILYGFGIGYFSGFPWTVSLVLGMIISLSSTMVVLKSLINRGQIGTLSGRVMIGILITQDLAAIPLMLIIPELSSIGENLAPIALTAVKALALLSTIVFIGIRIIPWILKFVAKLNSRELFLVTITSTGLGIGYLTHVFGLSLAFGAFVAGMVISESEYSHQALNDIIPLRDIFGLVFFTSIGMLLDPVFIYNNLTWILTLLGLVIAGKFVIFFLLSIAFRYYHMMPLALGFGLSQVGEFSFVLARTSINSGIINNDFYSLILSVSVLTMILSPIMTGLAQPVYSAFYRFVKNRPVPVVNFPYSKAGNHTVIVGGGRVGFQIASIFKRLEFPFILIEQDFQRFEHCKKTGFPVIYGDASAETVLSVANIKQANMIVITIPFIITAREIIKRAQLQNPGVKIIARVNDLAQLDELFQLNIFEVVQPEFEASLEMIRQSLMHLDVPVSSIYGLTDEIRRRHYTPLTNENLQQTFFSKIKNLPHLLDMSWIEITGAGKITGKSIQELAIRSETGISIVGILRNNTFIPNPSPNFIFNPGDYIAIIGLPENKKSFQDLFLTDK